MQDRHSEVNQEERVASTPDDNILMVILSACNNGKQRKVSHADERHQSLTLVQRDKPKR
jgi:hypothetical protein